ncbi:ABC transporter permease [Peterkaempfera bronchialis]|uniref:ABC transporter permease n=1 Tax=Peterkaempfera bronchialis TaxID=2126346 RepID=A0A345T1B9_9ACTN|nr:ABC transporter permease [Peterkaempfera bronchialis]AXI79774.1 ABC transporter permease [Peterkaempfera bronchialis]
MRSADRRSPRAARRALPPGLFAAPTLAWLALFFIAPVGLVFWYSLGRKPGLYQTHSNDVLTMGRYHEALSDTFLTSFMGTLRIGLAGTALCLAIGLPFAYWLAVKVRPQRRFVVLALVLVPFWTNFLIRTIGWQVVLSPEGFASRTMQGLGLIDKPFSMLFTPGAVLLGVVYNYLPMMILPLYVALDRIDGSLREASKDLGADRWRTALQITLPLARPGIVAGLLLVFIPLMGDYVTASVLGGARGNMVGQLIASQFQQGQNWALGSAMAIVLILVIALTILATAVAGIACTWLLTHRRRRELAGIAEGSPA